ncbi:iron-containing alcohol dehydrogenase [Ancylobacter pratisalsi]|uniref:Iron-containing alcohol dehydrogenase n=1 Tax=Ancylobacter pratisalsi TaxID=1745854 RepID=A0A6P1YG33_9HYPH|nr:iron-containing alcohol dehydrogenase [Ancylobacter pratisalsi]QIB32278.1 iron-containing alcohol dehydrogenase [Ancylobacter pratisalsi]
MTSFSAIRLPTEILFGKGQRRALPAVAQRLGQRALICTDERLAASDDFAQLVSGLHDAGLAVLVHDRVLPDVPRDSAAECAEAVRPFVPDLVIGVGGGSCLDMAKCAALLLTHGGQLPDYYGEYKVPGPVMPIIAVPTTAGTGSEATPVAVISDPDRTLKVGISSPHLIPRTAICDPELTLSCPPALTAIAGADALTHAIEAFTAGRRPPSPELAQKHVFVGKNALTDHFALLAIRLIGRSLERAWRDGTDEDARADVMMAALAAGCAFGTAGTAAAHAIQYPVGALTHTAHGLGVATMLPYVMRFNRDAVLGEMAEIALELGLPEAGRSRTALADAAIGEVVRLFAAIGIPPTLAALGLRADKLAWTGEQALGIERLLKNNPRPVGPAEMTCLLDAAYRGDLDAAASDLLLAQETRP